MVSPFFLFCSTEDFREDRSAVFPALSGDNIIHETYQNLSKRLQVGNVLIFLEKWRRRALKRRVCVFRVSA
jgi:hypothetical protein